MRSARVLFLGGLLAGPLIVFTGCGGGEDLSHSSIPASETPTGKAMLTKPTPVKSAGAGAGGAPTGMPTGSKKR